MPAALAISDAALDVRRCPFGSFIWTASEAELDVRRWLFFAGVAFVETARGERAVGGATAGVLMARRTSPARTGTSIVIMGAVCVIVPILLFLLFVVFLVVAVVVVVVVAVEEDLDWW